VGLAKGDEESFFLGKILDKTSFEGGKPSKIAKTIAKVVQMIKQFVLFSYFSKNPSKL